MTEQLTLCSAFVLMENKAVKNNTVLLCRFSMELGSFYET